MPGLVEFLKVARGVIQVHAAIDAGREVLGGFEHLPSIVHQVLEVWRAAKIEFSFCFVTGP